MKVFKHKDRLLILFFNALFFTGAFANDIDLAKKTFIFNNLEELIENEPSLHLQNKENNEQLPLKRLEISLEDINGEQGLDVAASYEFYITDIVVNSDITLKGTKIVPHKNFGPVTLDHNLGELSSGKINMDKILTQAKELRKKMIEDEMDRLDEELRSESCDLCSLGVVDKYSTDSEKRKYKERFERKMQIKGIISDLHQLNKMPIAEHVRLKLRFFEDDSAAGYLRAILYSISTIPADTSPLYQYYKNIIDIRLTDLSRFSSIDFETDLEMDPLYEASENQNAKAIVKIQAK